jgi:hypothetical protein
MGIAHVPRARGRDDNDIITWHTCARSSWGARRIAAAAPAGSR